MSVEHIPVLLSMSDDTPIGFGKIEGDQLHIVVHNQRVVDGIERLTEAGDIKEIYLGFGFIITRTVLERMRPE